MMLEVETGFLSLCRMERNWTYP